ncbi:MAG: glycosyltransferase family 39 protein, partial [Oligoflexia bacterium]|nr:glycosyltransferase family 39 protein [Oligoflexia bacterium]
MRKYLKNFFLNSASFDLQKPYQWTLIFTTSIVFLFQHLWVKGYFHDGYLYAVLGKNALLKGKWLLSSLNEIYFNVYISHPPLYFVIEGIFFSIFGHSWMSARGLSCGLALILTVLLSYFVFDGSNTLKKKIFNLTSWAYFSGIFFALFPPLYKKARSPNLDIPLTLFISLGLFIYYKIYKSKFVAHGPVGHKSTGMCMWMWMLVGVCFGLALLTKGPPALILPMTIALHLLVTGKLKYLFTPITLATTIPWIGLLLGIAIFSIWPLLLWQVGEFGRFKDYINMQFFGTIVEGRGESRLLLFTYPYYLLENLGPWFILSFPGIYLIIKERKENPLGMLFLSWYCAVLIPFSFIHWKYSN